MNILFVNNSDINPLNSGIQRITYVLAQAFANRGMNCFGAYFEENNSSAKTIFCEKIKIGFTNEEVRKLTEFVKLHQIHYVIAQECWPLRRLSVIREALIDVDNCQLIYCYHSKPGKEFVPPCRKVEFYHLIHSSNKINSFKKLLIAFLPSFLYSHLIQKRVQRDYASIYNLSDRIILLSDKYIPVFAKLSALPTVNVNKFSAIGNDLSFNEYFPPTELSTKKKEVLIVARLSDRVKRISLALKIWQNIEQTGNFQDWNLKIIGTGPDAEYYHHLVQKFKLKQVSFEGRQNPVPYYKNASIFMLTSAYEGFGIVLTEAQQMGVVPIAFDSYAAVHDIIENNRNGIITPNGDIEIYTKQLIHLMVSSEDRNRMALNGLKDCRQFEEKKIIQKWLNNFNIQK